jgi:septum formation inhibitor-activating ATPase MinD
MSRIIVYSGKGGVGKTSVAAATGLLAAAGLEIGDHPRVAQGLADRGLGVG